MEVVVDMMKTARNLDVGIVVSGDGDFASAIRAVQEMGVRCEVISFRGNTSSDLIDVADLFTDITQIAKVDKNSTRSGRRVADDDEDLSITEVPDKQSDGTGRGRGRARGRGGGPEGEAGVAGVAGDGGGTQDGERDLEADLEVDADDEAAEAFEAESPAATPEARPRARGRTPTGELPTPFDDME